MSSIFADRFTFTPDEQAIFDAVYAELAPELLGTDPTPDPDLIRGADGPALDQDHPPDPDPPGGGGGGGGGAVADEEREQQQDTTLAEDRAFTEGAIFLDATSAKQQARTKDGKFEDEGQPWLHRGGKTGKGKGKALNVEQGRAVVAEATRRGLDTNAALARGNSHAHVQRMRAIDDHLHALHGKIRSEEQFSAQQRHVAGLGSRLESVTERATRRAEDLKGINAMKAEAKALVAERTGILKAHGLKIGDSVNVAEQVAAHDLLGQLRAASAPATAKAPKAKAEPAATARHHEYKVIQDTRGFYRVMGHVTAEQKWERVGKAHQTQEAAERAMKTRVTKAAKAADGARATMLPTVKQQVATFKRRRPTPTNPSTHEATAAKAAPKAPTETGKVPFAAAHRMALEAGEKSLAHARDVHAKAYDAERAAAKAYDTAKQAHMYAPREAEHLLHENAAAAVKPHDAMLAQKLTRLKGERDAAEATYHAEQNLHQKIETDIKNRNFRKEVVPQEVQDALKSQHRKMATADGKHEKAVQAYNRAVADAALAFPKAFDRTTHPINAQRAREEQHAAAIHQAARAKEHEAAIALNRSKWMLARTRAGGTNNQPITGAAVHAEPGVLEHLSEKMGRPVTHGELGHIVGARPGEYVNAHVGKGRYGGAAIQFDLHGPGYDAATPHATHDYRIRGHIETAKATQADTLGHPAFPMTHELYIQHITGKGDKSVTNANVHDNPGAVRAFAHMVEGARASSIARIRTEQSAMGLHLAKLGFTAPMAGLRIRPPAELKTNQGVAGLLLKPGGEAWLQEHGDWKGIDPWEFQVKPGSPSRKVLKQTLTEVGDHETGTTLSERRRVRLGTILLSGGHLPGYQQVRGAGGRWGVTGNTGHGGQASHEAGGTRGSMAGGMRAHLTAPTWENNSWHIPAPSSNHSSTAKAKPTDEKAATKAPEKVPAKRTRKASTAKAKPTDEKAATKATKAKAAGKAKTTDEKAPAKAEKSTAAKAKAKATTTAGKAKADEKAPAARDVVKHIPVDQIHVGLNPREHFAKEDLADLAASIQKNGLLQPITVREHEGGYQVIAGERRLRAMRDALKWKEVPALVKNVSDHEAAKLALLENVVRSDMRPSETAHAYDRLVKGGMSIKEVASEIGKSEGHVQQHLELLQMPREIQMAVDGGHFPLSLVHPMAGISRAGQEKVLNAMHGGDGKKGLTVKGAKDLIAQIRAKENTVDMFPSMAKVGKKEIDAAAKVSHHLGKVMEHMSHMAPDDIHAALKALPEHAKLYQQVDTALKQLNGVQKIIKKTMIANGQLPPDSDANHVSASERQQTHDQAHAAHMRRLAALDGDVRGLIVALSEYRQARTRARQVALGELLMQSSGDPGGDARPFTAARVGAGTTAAAAKAAGVIALDSHSGATTQARGKDGRWIDEGQPSLHNRAGQRAPRGAPARRQTPVNQRSNVVPKPLQMPANGAKVTQRHLDQAQRRIHDMRVRVERALDAKVTTQQALSQARRDHGAALTAVGRAETVLQEALRAALARGQGDAAIGRLDRERASARATLRQADAALAQAERAHLVAVGKHVLARDMHTEAVDHHVALRDRQQQDHNMAQVWRQQRQEAKAEMDKWKAEAKANVVQGRPPHHLDDAGRQALHFRDEIRPTAAQFKRGENVHIAFLPDQAAFQRAQAKYPRGAKGGTYQMADWLLMVYGGHGLGNQLARLDVGGLKKMAVDVERRYPGAKIGKTSKYTLVSGITDIMTHGEYAFEIPGMGAKRVGAIKHPASWVPVRGAPVTIKPAAPLTKDLFPNRHMGSQHGRTHGNVHDWHKGEVDLPAAPALGSNRDVHGAVMPFTHRDFETALTHAVSLGGEQGFINAAKAATINGRDYIIKTIARVQAGENAPSAYSQNQREAAVTAQLHAMGLGSIAAPEAYHVIGQDGRRYSVIGKVPGMKVRQVQMDLAAHANELDLAKAWLGAYLTGQSDRHTGNMMYDHMSHKLTLIDFGFSHGHGAGIDSSGAPGQVWQWRMDYKATHFGASREQIVPHDLVQSVLGTWAKVARVSRQYGMPPERLAAMHNRFKLIRAADRQSKGTGVNAREFARLVGEDVGAWSADLATARGPQQARKAAHQRTNANAHQRRHRRGTTLY